MGEADNVGLENGQAGAACEEEEEYAFLLGWRWASQGSEGLAHRTVRLAGDW